MKPYFETENGKIYHCDARNILSLMSKIDLVLTDPPYGIGFKYIQYEDTPKNLMSLIENIIPLCIQKSVRTAIFCGVQNVQIYPVCDWIHAWSWDTTATFGKFGYNQWQPVLLYGEDVKGFGSINGVLKSDRLALTGGSKIGFLSEQKKGLHPCPKPINVIMYYINRLSMEGDLVFDPFGGSGTTAVACERMSRRWIITEIVEEYCEIAAKRIENEMKQLTLLASNNGLQPTPKGAAQNSLFN